jgi:hypothetical protein
MNTQQPMMGQLLVGILLGSALMLAGPAFAMGNAQKEISTAVEHAGYASTVKQVDKVHLHLHHVINCLVGPNGEGFYAAAGDPCKGQGSGALNDITSSGRRKMDLEHALTLAKTGTEITAFKPAHNVALAVKELLQAAEK